MKKQRNNKMFNEAEINGEVESRLRQLADNIGASADREIQRKEREWQAPPIDSVYIDEDEWE